MNIFKIGSMFLRSTGQGLFKDSLLNKKLNKVTIGKEFKNSVVNNFTTVLNVDEINSLNLDIAICF